MVRYSYADYFSGNAIALYLNTQDRSFKIKYTAIQKILWWICSLDNGFSILSPALAILFYFTGILIENAKRNWFIGIRTPWTMSSDKVWDKTHKIGGKLFKIAGLLALIAVFFDSYAIFVIIVPVIIVSIYTVIYSYFEYQKEMKWWRNSYSWNCVSCSSISPCFYLRKIRVSQLLPIPR